MSFHYTNLTENMPSKLCEISYTCFYPFYFNKLAQYKFFKKTFYPMNFRIFYFSVNSSSICLSNSILLYNVISLLFLYLASTDCHVLYQNNRVRHAQLVNPGKSPFHMWYNQNIYGFCQSQCKPFEYNKILLWNITTLFQDCHFL